MKSTRCLQICLALCGLLVLSSCSFVPFARIPFNVSLGQPLELPSAPAPTALDSADFNGDGHADLVSIHPADHQLAFYLGDGRGGFAPFALVSLAKPVAYAIRDFNGDGLPDVLILEDETSELAIVLGDRTQGLAFDRRIALAPSSDHDHLLGHPRGMALGDYNGDGAMDVALAYAEAQLEIFLGDGVGGFVEAEPLDTGLARPVLEAFDVDGDGMDDLLAFGNVKSLTEEGQYDGSKLLLFRGQTDGFLEPQELARVISGQAGFILLHDVDGNGYLDPVMWFSGNDTLSVLPSHGGGAFGKIQNYLVSSASGATFADLDQDGDADLITTHERGQFSLGRMQVFLNAGSLRFREPKPFSTKLGPIDVVSGDFNEDGLPDVAVANFYSNDLTLFFNETVIAGESTP